MDALVTASALEEFTRLPRPIQTRVIHLVDRLGNWPNVSGAKPLSGALADISGSVLAIIAYSFGWNNRT
jgi:hypothetical protein